MIELKQVTFQYDNAPENAHSIRNINLTIQNGECVVLCGRSGCGKTTITRLINGLIPHYYEGVLSGYVSVDGAEIKKQKLSKISQHVGSVFQHRSWRSDVKIRDYPRKMCWNESRMRRTIFA